MRHRLVGYDRRTELGAFEVPIPAKLFPEVASFVSFDDDDPKAVGCYEITGGQARKIIHMIRGQRSVPSGLSFYIEGGH